MLADLDDLHLDETPTFDKWRYFYCVRTYTVD